MKPQCANCYRLPELFNAMQKSLPMFSSRDAYSQFWKDYQDFARIYQCTDFFPERVFK